MNLKQLIENKTINLKALGLGTLIAALSLSAFAANNVPLNKYGAVNVNVNIPEDVQVPPAPANFKAPTIDPIAKQWANNENVLVPAQPKLDVKSYMLLDAKTGNIIASYNANKRIAPASLTKLMLLYIVEQQLANSTITLDTKLNVPTVAWATGGSRMFLKPKTQVSVRDLIQGVIVESGNDAAVTLAVGVAGSQSAFVDMMNLTAKRLGMTNTHFTDVMGLPAPNLYTSAHDLAILARHVIYDYPQYYHFFKEKYFGYNGIRQPNFNKLLFIDKYADGLKTGSTKAAGFSLISSEKRPGQRRLIAVVIGAKDGMASAYASLTLYRYGNQFFTTQQFYKAGEKIVTSPVYMGADKTINIGTSKGIALTLPKGINDKDIKLVINQKTPFKAPIIQGEQLGTLQIQYKGKTLAQEPLVALSNNPEGSLWQRIKGKMSLWFSSHG